jgi:ribose transport system permease protein
MGASTPETSVLGEPVSPPNQNGRRQSGMPVRDRLLSIIARSGNWWTLGVLAVIVVVFGVTTSDFLTKASWNATSTEATEVLLLALGETFVIVSRGIDLSVGGVLGLSGMAGAWVMSHFLGHISGTWDVVLGAAACCGMGAFAGVVNGLVVTRLNVSPFIATLGSLGIAEGATQLISGGNEISNLPPTLVENIGSKVWIDGWLPVPVAAAFVIAIICALSLHFTRFGKRTFAIGSNPEAAARTGINVKNHLLRVYTISGLLAGIAGFLVTAQVAVAAVAAGQDEELSGIAAVVIGGASLFGGRGTIAGSFVGTLIIAVLETGLIVAHVTAAWQVLAVGVILIAAVWTDQQRLRLAVMKRRSN